MVDLPQNVEDILMEEVVEFNSQTEEEGLAEWKDQCMAWCRAERDAAIQSTDYIHMPDVVISEAAMSALMAYRQELRDFPAVWESIFDSLADADLNGVTRESIKAAMPTKPV
jgi:hypothetical protein